MKQEQQIKSSPATLTTSAYLRIVLGFVISALAIYLVSRDISYHEVWAVLAEAHIGYIVLALLSVAINTLGKALRWKVLIGPSGQHIGFSKVTITLLIGQMLNTLIPARVGDISRAWVIGGLGPGRAFVFGTIVIEKFLDMIAYTALFLLLLLLIPIPHWINQSVSTLTTVAIIVGTGILLLALYRERCYRLLERLLERLPTRHTQRLVRLVRSGLSSLAILQSRPDRLRLLGLTILIWITAILNNYLVLLALNLHQQLAAPLVAALVLLVVLQAGLSLPSIPGNIGVFEYGCYMALSLFGIARATGLSYGILLHAIVLLPTTLLGLFFFWMLGLSLQQAHQEQSQESTPRESTPQRKAGIMAASESDLKGE
jgi:hypothetical protein